MNVSTEQSDFALEEYKQLSEWARVLYHARRQTVSLLVAGLTSLPVVIFGAAEMLQRGRPQPLQDTAIQEIYPLVGLLFLLLAAVGFLGFNHLISIRQQMTDNFRAINLIRGYFVAREGDGLRKWLRLPIHDREPNFLKWGGNIWYAAPIVFVNSALVAAGAYLTGPPGAPTWARPFCGWITVFVVSFGLMWVLYVARMVLGERQSAKRRSEST
jgi:ABC-type proline/glycine betaine transport system permease subunit